MKLKLLVMLFGILCLGIGQIILAQTPEPAAEENAEEVAESESPAIDTEEAIEQTEVNEPVPELPPLEAVLGTDDAIPEDSPERFIPTEQISQDLGVSFPSDI